MISEISPQNASHTLASNSFQSSLAEIDQRIALLKKQIPFDFQRLDLSSLIEKIRKQIKELESLSYSDSQIASRTTLIQELTNKLTSLTIAPERISVAENLLAKALKELEEPLSKAKKAHLQKEVKSLQKELADVFKNRELEREISTYQLQITALQQLTPLKNQLFQLENKNFLQQRIESRQKELSRLEQERASLTKQEPAARFSPLENPTPIENQALCVETRQDSPYLSFLSAAAIVLASLIFFKYVHAAE